MPAAKPLWTTFLRFLAPLMLSNALQSLFGTVSNALLGQMIGVDALAAVSVCFPVMFFLFAFVMGLSTGATVLIGQAWGAGERDKVKAVAGATLAVAAAQAGLVMPAAGKPNDPRISIGVRISPIAVDKASASSGVSASPTPRIIAVISRKMKPSGMVSSMMRA